MLTPEERLTEATLRVELAGGRVLTSTPLAHPESPHVVAAYRLACTAKTIAIAQAVRAVLADYDPPQDLITWTPEPTDDEDEGGEGE